jgi:hypothetical protein
MPLVRRKIKRCGWVSGTPNERDHLYAVLEVQLKEAFAGSRFAPAEAEARLRPRPVRQLHRRRYRMRHSVRPPEEKAQTRFVPSRLFICCNERDMECTVATDSGARIRDGIKGVANLGDCPETEWPYDSGKFATKPAANCFRDAVKYKAVLYQCVMQTLNQIRGCLASGYPFVLDFSVYESFESTAVAKTGIVPMPASSEKPTRRPRGARGRLRQCPATLHRPQFIGKKLGHVWVLHDAVCLFDGLESGGRFLDDSGCCQIGGNILANVCQSRN